MASQLKELARKNAERLNVLNRFMANDLFPTLPRERKDAIYEETRALNKLVQIQGKALELQDDKFTFEDDGDFPYPLVVFLTRYNGTYSGGAFVALNKDIDEEFDPDMVGSDVPCRNFWDNYKEKYGVGSSAGEAIEDLKMKLGVEGDDF